MVGKFSFIKNIFNNRKKTEEMQKIIIEQCYKQRFYRSWLKDEINTLDRYINISNRKKVSINLTKIRYIMPYRSISSIRCKVRERCAELGVVYSTYTQNSNNRKDKIWNKT